MTAQGDPPDVEAGDRNGPGDIGGGGAGGGGRERLVGAAVTWVEEHGFADVSLRELAAALGTSHRMLIYHFGSKEALWVEVLRAFEARQREAVHTLVRDAGESSADLVRGVWRQLSDPALEAQVRMFFRICGRALDAGAAADEVLSRIVGDWVEPMAVVHADRSGLDLDAARADVRFGVAAMRGLLLDLAATGDREAVDAAFERLAELWDTRGPRRASPRDHR